MQGRLVADRYRLEEAIGSGGMGRVWRAHDEVLHRIVAIKELTAALYVSESDQAILLARTRGEARAAARINHSAVVTVHDVLEHDGRPWIVMELVEGRSLADAVKTEERVEPREAARIGLWVLRALRAAHAAGVLHRDVKPGNVLLGDDGRVLLTDFGIAQIEGDSTITRTGEVVGSVDYLAPERVRGHDPGPSSDLWALGATLYTAVEGRSPFRRTSPLTTMQAVVEEEATEPRYAGPLAPVISALLCKDPQARPDATETEHLLAQAAEGRRPDAAQAYVPTTQYTGPPDQGDTPHEHPAGPATGTPYPPVAGPSMAGPPVAGPPGTGSAANGPTGSGPTGSGPMGSGPTGSGPTGTGPTAVGSAATGHTAFGPAATGDRVTGHTGTGPTAVGASVPGHAGAGYTNSAYGQSEYTDYTNSAYTSAGRPGHPGRDGTGHTGHTGHTGPGQVPPGHTATGPVPVGPGAPRRHRLGRPRTFVLVVAVAALIGAGTAVLLDQQGDKERGSEAGSRPTRSTSPLPDPSASSKDPGSSVPADWVRRNDPLGFGLSLPKGWKRKDFDGDSGELRQIDYTPDGGEHVIRISVDTAPDYNDPYTHQQDLDAQLGQRLVDYQRVALERVDYRDRDSARWEYTWTALAKDTSFPGPRRAVSQSYVSRDGVEYAFNMSGPASDWPTTRQQFRTVLQSWQEKTG
ncbi:serine/threonine-protein kinase [Streptomyces mayonensis]|uniref:serine/threonine-protein kinase n=1 Tax=Streptomyces mayonensis TaxID=2750816 RepID=UPI001C1E2FA6|nr:serine/threonine-protein kinase [Streptomyces sp. A108]MBU6532653.1 protein kinase [Streptomyces sp. A108]